MSHRFKAVPMGVRVDDTENPVLRELVDRILLTILCKATCHCQLIQLSVYTTSILVPEYPSV
jgi:hypothetical protein